MFHAGETISWGTWKHQGKSLSLSFDFNTAALSILQNELYKILIQTTHFSTHLLTSSFMPQSYLWNDNKSVVEWFEKELTQTDHSVIDENVKWISRDWILRQIKT